MRVYGLDEMQMITLFPLSLSEVTQHWCVSLDVSRRHTWEDSTHEFLSQYAFDNDVDVSR